MKLAALQKLLTAQLPNPDREVPMALRERLQKDRIHVYRGNFLGAQLRALETIYPVMQKILGDLCFGRLLRDFAIARPHQQRELGTVGHGFSEWLTQQLPQHPELADFAYLPELAQLELAHDQARRAADTPAFDFAAFSQALNRVGAEQLTLQTAPSLQVLCLRWPVDRLWQAQREDPAVEIADEPPPIHLAVLRQAQEVLHLRLDAPAYDLLQAAETGAPLALLATHGGPNQIPDLLRLGAIAGFSVLEKRQ